MRIDLIGDLSFLTTEKVSFTINKEYWAICKVPGEDFFHSHYARFLDKETLSPGESCKAEFKFKFSDELNFQVHLKANDIIDLHFAMEKIGEFKIEKILNEKLGGNNIA